MMLKAASNELAPVSLAHQSIMQIPIRGEKRVLGKIMVITNPSQPVDESDYAALAKTGEELGKKLSTLNLLI